MLTTYNYLQILNLFIFSHPYHVSVCDINYNNGNQSIEIIISVYIEDIELALSEKSKQKIRLGQGNEEQNNILLESYLKEKFIVKVNNTNRTCSYLGWQLEGDDIEIYLEIENVPDIESLFVKNLLMTELDHHQKNLVHFTYDKTTSTIELTKENPSGTFQVDTIK